MAEKVQASRGERVAISYKMPPNIYEKVNKLVYEEKKFSTVSDCITQALLSFVDNHHDMGQFRELFKDYLSSDEGRELMKTMMKEVLLDVLSNQKWILRMLRVIHRKRTSTISFLLPVACVIDY